MMMLRSAGKRDCGVKTREIERAGRRWFVLGEGPGLAGVEKSFRTLREALAWCRTKGYPVRVYRVTKKGWSSSRSTT
ncbi:MAG: hypothetical protein ACOYU7_02285 [Bacillota bacterium]